MPPTVLWLPFWVVRVVWLWSKWSDWVKVVAKCAKHQIIFLVAGLDWVPRSLILDRTLASCVRWISGTCSTMRVKTQMGVARRIVGHIIVEATMIMMTRRALRTDEIPNRERGMKRMPFTTRGLMVPKMWKVQVSAGKSSWKTSWVESLVQRRMPMLPTRNLPDSGVLVLGRKMSGVLMGF
ncbi:uncharacterized protein LOC127742539 isoform X2 [Arachis duranensis]|uniref:Uncharacterized protein LOC127742539 isoform X2 n=1 Tax=Arachis duranensis TaxID=130453 RepID=A0A9C6WQY2_ARADU|nr:uncharacterized protein LOC127742539 isoform X2 [Arachis duranensis]